MLEIWDPTTLSLPHSVTFKFKSDTGLYDLAKAKTTGRSIEVHRQVALPSQTQPLTSHALGVTDWRHVQRCNRIQENTCVSALAPGIDTALTY
jgi:hypothetical protein